MAASLRFIQVPKKIPYLTALKAVARDANHSNERRVCFQRPSEEIGPKSLENDPSTLSLHTIGYEDKRKTQDKPTSSHPGEYVTPWGDFRPSTSSKGQPESLPQKPTSSVASLLPSRPQEWETFNGISCYAQPGALTALLMDQSRHRFHAAAVRALGSHENVEAGILTLDGLSLSVASLLESTEPPE